MGNGEVRHYKTPSVSDIDPYSPIFTESPVGAYFGVATYYALELTHEDERALADRLQAGFELSPDLEPSTFQNHELQTVNAARDARDSLVLTNLKWAATVVARYRWAPLLHEDLLHEGVAGMVRATKTFDPEKGRFRAYARSYIQQRVLRAIDDTAHMIRVPVSVEDDLRAILSKQQDDSRKNLAELCTDRGADIESVQAAQNSRRIVYTGSPITVRRGRSVSEELEIEEVLEEPNDQYEAADARMDGRVVWRGVQRALGVEYGEKRARVVAHVLVRRFVDEAIYADVGKEIGITGGGVQKMQKVAVAYLRGFGRQALYDIGRLPDASEVPVMLAALQIAGDDVKGAA